MRFFKQCDNWLDCVVGEMINIETGKKYFDRGVLIPPTMKDGKPLPRPANLVFVRSKRTVTVKHASEGLLFITVDRDILVSKLEKRLDEMYKIAGYADSLAVFGERRPIHTAAGHFTSVTAMATLPSSITLRAFHGLEAPVKFRSHLGHMFTWYVVRTAKTFIELVLDYRASHLIPVYLQLLGICYDSSNMFRFEHDQRYDSTLTFGDIRWTQQLLHQCTYGDIRDVMKAINDMKQEGRDEAKEARKKKPAAKASDAVQKETYTLISAALRREYDEFCGHPAYLPGYSRDDAAIKICVQRGPFFEISRWLGGSGMFGVMVPIDAMYGVNIYDVEFSQISWPDTLSGAVASLSDRILQNPKFTALQKHDFCQRCRTPIYDQGYAVFDSPNTNVGTPYCMTCMHLRYNEKGMIDLRGSLLCKGKVLAHYKTPLTLSQVLDMLPNQDPTYRAILTDNYEAYKYMASETDRSGTPVLVGAKFIGVCDSLSEYAKLCYTWEVAGHTIPIKPIYRCAYVRIW